MTLGDGKERIAAVNDAEPRRVRIELRGGPDGAIAYKGMLYARGGVLYIKYEEDDESRGRCRVTLKWDGSSLTLLRHGEVQGEQIFRLGRRTAGWHATPAGKLRLETETRALRHTAAEAGGLPFTIEWQYELWVNEYRADRFDLRLRVEEDQSE